MIYDTVRETAVGVAERIREAFAQAALEVDGRPVGATVSIGLAHCPDPILDLPELLAQADQALYHAKASGRNRVEVASLELVLARKDGAAATPVEKVTAQSAA